MIDFAVEGPRGRRGVGCVYRGGKGEAWQAIVNDDGIAFDRHSLLGEALAAFRERSARVAQRAN